jgi:hypothetical protein
LTIEGDGIVTKLFKTYQTVIITHGIFEGMLGMILTQYGEDAAVVDIYGIGERLVKFSDMHATVS